MRIGSLFSGYSGLDMAVQSVIPDAHAVWHCEWDAAPSKILAHHYPDVPNLKDVTLVDWEYVRDTRPVDILTGGYPCQPFSAAGQRKGTDDERHLWPYVREAIRVLRPRFALLENVAGHRSLGFDRVLGDLAEDGLHVRWTSLRAADVGAAHGRERLFIVVTDAGCTNGQRWTLPVQGGAEGGNPTSASQRPSAAAVDGAIKTLPTPRASRGASHTETVRLLPTPTTSDTNGAGKHGTGGLDLRTAVSVWGDYEDAIARQAIAVGRPAPEPTRPNRAGNPQLSAAFVEWLMMLPEGWVTDPAIGLTRNEQLKALGNGVVPAQGAAALASLLEMSVAV